jgi:hypothetical protein
MPDVRLHHPAGQPQLDQLTGRVTPGVHERRDDRDRDRAEAAALHATPDLAHRNGRGQLVPLGLAHPRGLVRRLEVFDELIVLAQRAEDARARLAGPAGGLAPARVRVRAAGREVHQALVVRGDHRVQPGL